MTESKKRMKKVPEMKQICIFGIIVSISLIPISKIADAGEIERACHAATEATSSQDLCTCIQDVAEQRLSAREQKVIAGWLIDPDKAMTIRTSKRRHDVQLWSRYREFGSIAQDLCG